MTMLSWKLKKISKKYLNDERRINFIRKLRNISEDDFKVMEGTNAQNPRRRLIRQLKHMVVWMQYYNSENDDLPNTTE